MKKKKIISKNKTSWDPVHKWYSKIVGKDGHYYHKQVILPNLLKLMDIESHIKPSFLDLACGQGILANNLPRTIPYVGIDISPSLIKEAKKQVNHPLAQFKTKDITKRFNLQDADFSHAAIILALQNLEDPYQTFLNAHRHLRNGGELHIVMNHPCFRIPRQTHWEVDKKADIQYRRINRYMTPLSIPIHSSPSKGEKSPITFSFHYPLSMISEWLCKSGFVIHKIEEWCSDKKSTGKAAKRENLSRKEIPLFLAIKAISSASETVGR